MKSALNTAEARLWLKGHGVALLLGSVIAGFLICIVAGSGAWVFAGNRSEFVGFCADPSYLLGRFPGLNKGRAVLAASFAHHFFFPFVCMALVSRSARAICSEKQLRLLCARGVNPIQRYAKVLLLVVALSVCYSAAVSVLVLTVRLTSGAPNAAQFLLESLLIALVDASFATVCFSVQLIVGSRVIANVVLLVATYVTLIISMVHPSTVYPSHMSIWMHICGFEGPSLAAYAVVFSLVSACASIVLARVSIYIRSKSI